MATDKMNLEAEDMQDINTAENVEIENDAQQQADVEVEAVEEEAKDDLTLALEKVEELNDKNLRMQAEFDNYRKRTLKEKIEMTKSAGEKLLKDILPVMDDFERAIDTLNNAESIEVAKEGLSLIYNKFESFLKQNGVEQISTEDGIFDTELHEAITQIPSPTEDLKGKIIDCVQKGYTLNDKVIRHSKVVVGA